jgi:hypothetical protein
MKYSSPVVAIRGTIDAPLVYHDREYRRLAE